MTHVRFEFFGVPRLRAGRAELSVEGETVGEALGALARALPKLGGMLLPGPALHPAYRLSLNGERFVSDPETPLAEGDCLLLLAADVGG